ncbi:cohesin domain-containing protein [Patescibacteria group bacterium]
MNWKVKTTINKFFISFIFVGLGLIFWVRGVNAVGPSLRFDPEKVGVQTGDEFEVNVVFDTAGVSIGGVGVKINFKPEDIHASSIIVRDIFDDYPTAAVDNNNGRIIISGIVSGSDNLYKGEGVFATIVFKAKSPGTSVVEFEYEPGSTRDSNIAITSGSGDALSQVSSLTVVVGGEGGGFYEDRSSDTDVFNYVEDVWDDNDVIVPEWLSDILTQVFDRIPAGRGLATELKLIPAINDPYGPINSLQPKTDISQKQVASQTNYTSTKESTEKSLYLTLKISLTLLGFVFLFFVYRIYMKNRKPKVVIKT